MHICTSVSELDVERAKNTLRSKLLLNLDGTTPISDDIGKQILYNGRRIPFHELDAKIEVGKVSIFTSYMMNIWGCLVIAFELFFISICNTVIKKFNIYTTFVCEEFEFFCSDYTFN